MNNAAQTGTPSLCSTPWDEIVPGLWMGCHDYMEYPDAPYESDAFILPDDFDIVFSLYRRHGLAVPDGIERKELFVRDDRINGLSPDDTNKVRAFADEAYDHHQAGRKVLVRCQAGLNRSGLVVALALLRMGYSASEAVALIRERRSPWALYNERFVGLINATANA